MEILLGETDQSWLFFPFVSDLGTNEPVMTTSPTTMGFLKNEKRRNAPLPLLVWLIAKVANCHHEKIGKSSQIFIILKSIFKNIQHDRRYLLFFALPCSLQIHEPFLAKW